MDCIIIGAGPAGLTAAIYLARFQRKFVIVDNHTSRVELIPLSHNYPGYSNGISGSALLTQLREQLQHYPVESETTTITKIEQLVDNSFVVYGENFEAHSKKIILATGVVDIEPVLPQVTQAIKCGLIRHCVVCDGFEVKDKHVAVIGVGESGITVVKALRHYTNKITLLTLAKEINITN